MANSSHNLFFPASYNGPTYGAPRMAWFVNGNNSSELGTIAIERASGAGKIPSPTFLSSCIINTISQTREVACQPEPTLSGNLYLNFFGDKATKFSISGAAFDRLECSQFGGQNDSRHNYNPAKSSDSARSIIDFYEEYRLQSKEGVESLEENSRHQIKVVTYNSFLQEAIHYVGILIMMELKLSAQADGLRRYDFTFTFISLN